jgi:hypothetical protein
MDWDWMTIAAAVMGLTAAAISLLAIVVRIRRGRDKNPPTGDDGNDSTE